MFKSSMDRRHFLNVAAGALAPQASQTRRPNVLFVLADQWRAQTLGVAGDPNLRAPNLDQLAKGGVYFSRAYTAYPVCTPARGSILTGQFPHACGVPRNHMQLPLAAECLPALLRDAGYATGYIGKWQLDGEEFPGFVPPGPRRRGFDYWAAFNQGHQYFDPVYYRDTAEPLRPGGFEPDYQTRLALEFIKQNNQRPFFLFLSWGPPHAPLTPPPRFARLYDPRQIHLRENVPESQHDEARQRHAGYYGLCSALDENMGRLLSALDDNRIAEDTIVVFTSDHGIMLGSHGLDGHNLPFEESARIPLLVRYPRRLGTGQTNDVLISTVDYAPTLLSLCGVQALAAPQGQDLAPFLLDGKGRRPESIYVQGKLGEPEEWRMLVRGLDKIVTDARGDVTQLYNLGQDPFEMQNLASDPGQERRRDELKALLREWMKRLGDGMTASGLKKRV